MSSTRSQFTIAALLIVIFALGGWVGHEATVRWQPRPHRSSTAAAPGVPGDADSVDEASRDSLRRYRGQLDLTREQVKELWPLFEKTGRAMTEASRESGERIALVESLHTEMEPHLTDAQKDKNRTILEATRLRHGAEP